ncbi:MAG: LuxR family two component transcriptional regulator [Pedosphaera sp.]|nr:LuxR family two component transcriptional regulator [Pedosphaera sp.]
MKYKRTIAGLSHRDLYRRLSADVLLLDMAMPGLDGIETLRRLKSPNPEARVLMLSSSDVEEDIIHSLHAGAAGYMTKTARTAELTTAIIVCHEGKRVISPAIQTAGAGSVSGNNAVLLGTLLSAGLPSATVQVFWGVSNCGTIYTGRFVSLTQSVSGLTPGTSNFFRFRASNTNGESWGMAQMFATLAKPALTLNCAGCPLAFTWFPNYLGWILQAQTNGLNSNGWFDVNGNAGVISTNIPINPANTSVFYRLRQP